MLAAEKRQDLALEDLEVAEAITDHAEDPLVVHVTVLVDENVASPFICWSLSAMPGEIAPWRASFSKR